MRYKILGHDVDSDLLNPKIGAIYRNRMGGNSFLFRTDHTDHTESYYDKWEDKHEDWGDSEGYISGDGHADSAMPFHNDMSNAC